MMLWGICLSYCRLVQYSIAVCLVKLDCTCLRIDLIRNHCIRAIEKWGKCNNREKRGISLFLFYVLFSFYFRFIYVFSKTCATWKRTETERFINHTHGKKMLLSKLAAKIIRIEIFYINLFSLFILLASTCCSISFQFLLSSLILHS